MLYFNEIVENLLSEAQVGVPVTRTGQPVNPNTASTTNNVNWTPGKPFYTYVSELVVAIYKTNNATKPTTEDIIKTYMVDYVPRVVGSGYNTIKDEELLSTQKYWPIMDFGLMLLKALRSKQFNASRSYTALLTNKSELIENVITDQDTLEDLFQAYTYLIKNIKEPIKDFKEPKDYRLNSLKGKRAEKMVNAVKGVANALGNSFGQYFKVL